jgi:hypothetical protein
VIVAGSRKLAALIEDRHERDKFDQLTMIGQIYMIFTRQCIMTLAGI